MSRLSEHTVDEAGAITPPITMTAEQRRTWAERWKATHRLIMGKWYPHRVREVAA